MRLQRRNTTEFEYLPWTGEETDLDEETGLHTGIYRPEYGEPVTYRGNISVPSLTLNPTFYGSDIRYTHVLLMDNPQAEIDEFGQIRWRDERYEIRAVRRSQNGLSAALRRLTRNHAEDDETAEKEEP